MNPDTDPIDEVRDVASTSSAPIEDQAIGDDESVAGDIPTPEPSTEGSKGAGSKHEDQLSDPDQAAKHEIRSLQDLVDYAYAQSGKQVHLKASTVEALVSDGIEIGVVEQHLRTLTRLDMHLAVPVRLLAAFDRSSASPRLRKKINRLATFALTERLPSIRERDGRPFELPSDQLDPYLDELEARVSNTALANLGFPDGDAADRATLLDNAITLLVLVAAWEHRWKPDQTIRTLDRRVWRRQLARSKRPDVGQLAESRSPETLALVGDAYTAEIEQMRKAVDSAERERAAAEAQIQHVCDEATTLRYHVSKLEATVKELGLELNATIAERDQARESARVTGSHAVDDYEQLRTRIVRMLRDRLRLLDDALHALQRERYQVTEEFVERAIEDLRREYESMQSGTGGEE